MKNFCTLTNRKEQPEMITLQLSMEDIMWASMACMNTALTTQNEEQAKKSMNLANFFTKILENENEKGGKK